MDERDEGPQPWRAPDSHAFGLDLGVMMVAEYGPPLMTEADLPKLQEFRAEVTARLVGEHGDEASEAMPPIEVLYGYWYSAANGEVDYDELEEMVAELNDMREAAELLAAYERNPEGVRDAVAGAIGLLRHTAEFMRMTALVLERFPTAKMAEAAAKKLAEHAELIAPRPPDDDDLDG